MKIEKNIPSFRVFFLIVFLVSGFSSIKSYSQPVDSSKNNIDRFSGGIGLGLDYGGFGLNVIAYPQRNLGLFAGAGFALAGIGYNFGIKLRLLPKDKPPRAVPYLTGMYGYNAAVYVSSSNSFSGAGEEDNKLFYGPSIGAGCDLYSKHQHYNYLSFALLVPLRSPDVNHYIDSLQTNEGVQFKLKPLPVLISIGYHFGN